MKNYLLLISLTLLVIGCSTTTSKNTQPQPVANGLMGEWVYCETMSDEFDALQVDTNKWHLTNPHWLGRKPSLFRKENVEQREGMLILKGKREDVPNAPEGYHTFTSAAVQSKDTVLYGFFEIRCKAMNSALSSAFWLYVQDSVKQEEIDIFEICGRNVENPSYDSTYFATSHLIIKTHDLHISDHVAHNAGFRYADQFIVSGLEWRRDSIIWWLNGERIRSRKNDFWHSPETVNFDSEAFPGWWGLPSDDDNGGEFQIEYFRYWTNRVLK